MLTKDPRVLIGALPDNFKRLRREYLTFDYSSRLTLGTLFLAFFSMLSIWGQFADNLKEFAPNLGLATHDSVSLYEQRFTEVKRILPKQGVVGYLGDTPADSAEFYMTQYALSPLIVDKTQPHELVIGNFANRNLDPKMLTYMSLNVRADFGNGVKLFSLESK